MRRLIQARPASRSRLPLEHSPTAFLTRGTDRTQTYLGWLLWLVLAAVLLWGGG